MTNPRTTETLFEGLEIGFSISESPELESLGFSVEHLVEVMAEFARQVLFLGGSVAYGGDLRPGGFTEQLLELASRPPVKREQVVHSYLAWPIHNTLTQARADELAMLVRFERLASVEPPLDGKPTPYLWARNLTDMRERMTANIAARIIVGGRITGALGAMPGVIEEALLSIEAKQPLFLIGAMGGCAKLAWRAVCGEPTPELDLDYQTQANPAYGPVVQQYNAWAAANHKRPVNPDAIRATFKTAGPAGLSNGLTAEENARLAETPYIPEMIALVLHGCRRFLQPRG